MGLVDKLTELDQYIWKQHEKATNYCYRELGWNKYDLAKKSHLCETASFAGAAIYSTLECIKENIIFPSALYGLLTATTYYSGKHYIKKKEEEELRLLEQTGAGIEPRFSASRPAWYFGLSTFFGHLAYWSITKQGIPPENSSLSSEEFNLFGSLIFTSLFISNIFRASKTYFLDQIMAPPKKKKSVLKTLYEKVKGKIQAVPQLEPARPTKYRSKADHITIDNLVSGE